LLPSLSFVASWSSFPHVRVARLGQLRSLLRRISRVRRSPERAIQLSVSRRLVRGRAVRNQKTHHASVPLSHTTVPPSRAQVQPPRCLMEARSNPSARREWRGVRKPEFRRTLSR
jgi:hypothetical protein